MVARASVAPWRCGLIREDPAAGYRGPDRRSPFDDRSWRVRRAGHGPGETGMTQGVARRVCVRKQGTDPGRGPTREGPVPAERCERSPPVRPRRVMRSPPGRAGVSRSRTQANGSTRGCRSRTKPGVAGPRQTSGPGRPRCRRRSPVASVAFQFTEQHRQRRLRTPAAGGFGSRRECGRQPTLPHRIGKHGVRQDGTPRLSRRADFGHDAPSIRDENGLATSRKSNVLAKLAVQCPDSDRSHESNVATCSYYRQFHSKSP